MSKTGRGLQRVIRTDLEGRTTQASLGALRHTLVYHIEERERERNPRLKTQCYSFPFHRQSLILEPCSGSACCMNNR